MPTNDFKPFATAPGANVKSQAQYLAAVERTAGMATGIAESALFNKVWRQSAFMAAVLAEVMKDATAADVLDDGDFATKVTQLKAAIVGTASGRYGATGIQGKNNAGVPNTKYDLSARQITLRNPVSGICRVRDAPAVLTNDLGVAGVNGRDGAAFAVSSWVYLYWIDDGVTLATLSSATGPVGGGPALPVGYTMWAYAGAVRKDAGGLLLRTYFAGSLAFYGAGQNIINVGMANIAETALDISAQVPPDALAALLSLETAITSPGAGNTGNSTLSVRVVSGLDYFLHRSLADNSDEVNTAQIIYPLLAQQLIYQQAVANAGVTAFTQIVNVNGYRMPNGGE